MKRVKKKTANKPQHVFITGLPGSGKTTLAKKIAGELGLPLISLDEISRENNHTNDFRRIVRELDESHVIEGTQLLGFNKQDFEGHHLQFLEEPKDVLVDRLVQRGWNDDGRLLRGEGARSQAEGAYENLSPQAERFKKHMMITPAIERYVLKTAEEKALYSAAFVDNPTSLLKWRKKVWPKDKEGRDH